MPEQILLGTELICRQSCGCQNAMMQIRSTKSATQLSTDSVKIVDNRVDSSLPGRKDIQRDIDSILSALAAIRWLDLERSRRLVQAFFDEAIFSRTEPGSFIQVLTEILSQIQSGTEIIEWQDVLNIIRSKIDHLLASKDEIIKSYQLLGNGNTLIGEMAHRKQLSEGLEAVNQTNRLNHIVQTMATTYDIETLMKLLAQELPALGIQSCYLSLYDEKGKDPTWSRMILAFVDNQRLPLVGGGLRFPTRELVPQGMLPQDRCFAFDVEALLFQEEQIGFVLFEIGPRNGDVYTTLRGHLSSALKSAELVQIALEAEAKAIKSDQLKTHLLANVSHELRTPLNIILGSEQYSFIFPEFL